MKITIIGTGNMARAIGTRALAAGIDVTVVGKDEQKAGEARGALSEAGGEGTLDTAAAGAGVDGDLVVLAVYYADAREAVEQYAGQLDGKVVIDVTNPVNESFDGLVVPPDSSATRELGELARGARFVKAFNTTFAKTIPDGEVSGHQLDVFIAGDDEAREQVASFVSEIGLNPVEAGGIERARELEALGLLHMTLQSRLGTGFASAAKVVT